jgi:hypothetical protein
MKGVTMSGRFIPSVRFPIYVEDCKSGRIQVEPILCQFGYGALVKIVLVRVKGTGDKAYEYEQVVYDGVITQETLPEGSFYETAYEYFEGFYYNKISQDVVVPLTAIILKNYFSDVVENCQLDLSEYVMDLGKPEVKQMGYGR